MARMRAQIELGTLGAYIGLAAGHSRQLDTLSRVPVLELTAIGAGVPLIAIMAGWLLAGRQPPAIAGRAQD
jgi:putative ABC transport system permease protein